MSENIVQLVTAAAGGDSDAAAKFYAKTLKTSYYLAYALANDESKTVEITKTAYANSFASFDKLLIPEAYEIWLKQNIATAYKDITEFSFADAETHRHYLLFTGVERFNRLVKSRFFVVSFNIAVNLVRIAAENIGNEQFIAVPINVKRLKIRYFSFQ